MSAPQVEKSQKNISTVAPSLLGLLFLGASCGDLTAQGRTVQRVDGKLDRRAVLGPGSRETADGEGLELSVIASIAYDDNIFQSATDQTESVVVQLEPSIGWTAGQRDNNWVRVAYDGTAVVYLSESSGDRIDHRFSLEGGVKLDSVALAYSAEWSRLGSPSADVGGTSDRNEWGGRIAAVYQPKGKFSYELSAEHAVVDQVESAFFDFFESSVGLAARYRYSSKTQAALAYRFGQASVEGSTSSDQSFHRVGGEFVWRPRSKVSVSLEAGLEYRDYDVGSGTDPYLSARIDWAPRAKTALYLEAFRREQASAGVEGENLEITGVRAGVTQVLRGGWSAGLEVGWQNSDYFGIVGLPESGREDDLTFFRPSLRYTFSEDAVLVFLYQWSENDSTDSDFGYENHQLGVSMNYSF